MTYLMRYWKSILIILLAVYALPVAYYILFGTLGSHGATDFHQFWYAGQFILMGQDPYQAYFSGVSLPMRQPGLESGHSNTPLLQLVLSTLSIFPWSVAKIVWLVLNLLLVALSFWLVVDKLPFPLVSLDRQTKVLIFLLFFDLSPTRIAIENGQTTLLVFVLMLAAVLLAKRSWGWSGFLLGLALSKYSVSLPVVLFLLYHRNFRVLVTALLTQFFGFVGLSILSGTPILLVFGEYIQLFISLIDQPGIHLANLVPGTRYDLLPSAVMSIVLAALLYLWLFRWKPSSHVDERVLDFHLLTILALWSLLVAYHRLYDAVVIILLIVLVFKSFQRADVWNLTLQMRAVVAWGLGIGLALLTIAARIVDALLPGMYDPLTNDIPAVVLLVFLSALMALLYRFLYPPVFEVR